MRPIEIGVQLHPQHTTYADYARAWLRADDLGVDSIWTWDHFFPLYGTKDGPHFEGWTLLAALGAQSKRARVGCLVLSMGYRNPALLSAMAKTLDHATAGRLILGLGAGWFQRDYAEYGYEFGTAGDRLRLLDKGLKIIKERWERDQPPPVRGTIPILIGGGGEKVTLRIAAQHANLWHGFGSPSEWGRKSAILDNWCRKVGRDPATIVRSSSVNDGKLGDLDAYVGQGATHLIYELKAPFEFGPVQELLAWRDARNNPR